MTRTCIECGEKLRGRSDKKFCSDHCRSAYHNRINAQSNEYIRLINRKNKKNRKILMNLIKNNCTSVSRFQLASQGFDFAYFTHQRTTGSGLKMRYSYDIALLSNADDSFAIIKEKQQLQVA